MSRVPPRRARLFGIAALGLAALVGACRETIDGGAACSAALTLCPGQEVQVRDTIISPVLEWDSTYVGFPTRGSEFLLPLIAAGDTVQSNVIVRFDSLTTFYLPPLDTARGIVAVDSSRLRITLELSRSRIPDSVRVDVYDVDHGGADDTASAPVLARFVPKYRIGGATFAKANIVDSLYVPLSDSAVLAHVQDTTAVTKARMRVGISVAGIGGPVWFRIGSVESGVPVVLRYRPAKDSGVVATTVNAASTGPSDRPDIKRDLMDYALLAKNTLPDKPGVMALGGMPGRRVYMRFNVPKRITDSTTVVRATLRLNQLPYPFGGAADTVFVHPHIVLASANITDARRASTLIGLTGLIVTDSLMLTPRDSGQRSLELYPLVRAWAAQSSLASPPVRALVLTASYEGTIPAIITFSGMSGPAALRPTMRITYIPKVQFGVP